MNTNKFKSLFHPLAMLLIVTAAVAGYANSFQGPFLFDDYHNIVGNKNVQISRISYDSLKRAAVEEPSRYRWIPKITFGLNYYFAEKEPVDFHAQMKAGGGHGLAEPEVWGYHLVNLLIHILSGIFLYFLFMLTLRTPVFTGLQYTEEIALLGALLWIANPVQTNAVTYVVQRMTGLGALFSIMAMLFYVLGRRLEIKAAWKYVLLFVLALFSWLLALVSKENAAMLPAIVVAYEIYFLGGISFSLKNKKTFIGLAGAVALVIGIGWLYTGSNPFSYVLHGYGTRDFTLGERLLTQPRVVLHYLSLLLLPIPSRLTLAYDWPASTGLLTPPATALAILGLTAMVLLIFLLFRRDRLLSFAIFWFLANLLIESSAIPLEMVFEHRVYLPSAFVLLYAAYFMYQQLLSKKIMARGVAILLVALSVFMTFQRNITWADRENVWKDVSEKSPNLIRGHMGLYMSYKAQGRVDEAINALQKAVEVGPDEFRPSFNLANLYKEQKNYKQALLVVNNMLKKPTLRTAPAYHLRASIYYDLGNFQMAVRDGLQAIQVDSNHKNSVMILGSSYFRMRDFKNALIYFNRARELDPSAWEMYFNLGTTHFNLGQYDQAIFHYRQAINLQPNNADLHYNLGMVYGAKGMVKEMQEEMAASRRLKGVAR